MKVRLKKDDDFNNVKVGTIFDAENIDQNFLRRQPSHWVGWVEDIHKNKRLLSYSREDLELVVRKEISELYAKISANTSKWLATFNHDHVIISHKELDIRIVLNTHFNSFLDVNVEWDSVTLSPEETLFLSKLYFEIDAKAKEVLYQDEIALEKITKIINLL